MNQKFITEVTENEKIEIEQIFERINSLKSLSITLNEYNSSIFENGKTKENGWFFDNIISDLNEAYIKYNEWWKKCCSKYGLDINKLDKYIVNFQNGFLYLNE